MQSWVIKIGGSLYSSEYLIEWLEAIARNADCKILLVPGGGPFADLVRQADNTFNLDQDHAHRMAVMAMQQYGTFLASLCPKLQLADSRDKIQRLWDSGHAVIWEPINMMQNDCPLDKNWEQTSDSIAAWIASYLNISNLLLVKSSEQVIEQTDLNELAQNGCIDPNLPNFITENNQNIQLLHKSQIKQFEDMLQR